MLGHSDVFLSTVGDIDLLSKALEAANRFSKRPAIEEMDAMMKKNKMSSLFGIGT